MWKPPQRIKYTAVDDNWPSREQAAASRLFSPLQMGPMRLEQRSWVPAMVPWRSNESGEVTDDVLEWYQRFARGKPGAIVVEATGIRDVPSGPLLRIGHDRCMDGLSRLADTVREASGGRTRLLIQLIDFLTIRRRPEREKFLQRFLPVTDEHRRALGLPDAAAVSAVRNALCAMSDEDLESVLAPREWEDLQFGYRERVTDVQVAAIAELPQTLPALFASAASRAQRAGFDGVELHYAHAYTMASFLSATNVREDGYGGSREQRVRLPLDVYRRVREVTGEHFAVGCRFLSDEIIEGGSGLDDARYFARRFAQAGMDFLSLSRGGKFDDAKRPKVGWAAYPYTGRSGYECMPGYMSDEQGPFQRNVAPVASIRHDLRASGFDVPLVVAGGIFGFAAAERILKNGEADVIGLARQALADPDWFEKVRTGSGTAVRLCRYSNYCEGLDQKHKQVTCELWDREGLDAPGVSLSHDGKRRLVAPPWTAPDPDS